MLFLSLSLSLFPKKIQSVCQNRVSIFCMAGESPAQGTAAVPNCIIKTGYLEDIAGGGESPNQKQNPATFLLF
jgi:hypothetical protein